LNLVYTFNSKVHLDTPSIHIIYRYYLESILRAKNLGYKVEIYTDVDWLTDKVDRTYKVESYDSLLWDAFKFIPLEERDDDFILLDGDVFLDSKFILPADVDLVCDTYEKSNWNILYSKTVKKLSQLGINNVIEEWDSIPRKVLSCGVLVFFNKTFQKIYVDRWKKLNTFINSHKEELDLYSCTATAAQFLLTVLADKHNIKVATLSEKHGVSNGTYVHYAGKAKFKNNYLRTEDSLI
jgi:hypothetical protein